MFCKISNFLLQKDIFTDLCLSKLNCIFTIKRVSWDWKSMQLASVFLNTYEFDFICCRDFLMQISVPEKFALESITCSQLPTCYLLCSCLSTCNKNLVSIHVFQCSQRSRCQNSKNVPLNYYYTFQTKEK